MLRRTHPNHFTTIHIDYAKPQAPYEMVQMIEEAHPAPRSALEPIRKVHLAPPKKSKFQRG